jgi:hypothetical protein
LFVPPTFRPSTQVTNYERERARNAEDTERLKVISPRRNHCPRYLLFLNVPNGAPVVSRADEFRKNAEESRLQAEKARSISDKEHWLKIAEQWLKMAQDAEIDHRTRK